LRWGEEDGNEFEKNKGLGERMVDPTSGRSKRLVGYRLMISTLIILLSFLTPTLSAESCDAFITGYSSLIFLSVTVIILILTLSYMIAVYVNNSTLKSKIYVERGNLVLSIVITLLLLFSAYLTCLYVSSLASSGAGGGSTDDMYSILHQQLTNTSESSLSQAKELTRSMFEDQLETMYYMFVGTPFTPAGGAGKSYRAYYEALATHKRILVRILLTVHMIARTYDVILRFIKDITFTALIPLAIVLRLFPGVRSMGNYLMAFVFAFGIVLPMVLVIVFLHGGSVHIPDVSDRYVGSYSEIARLVAQVIILPNFAIAISASVFLAVGRMLDNISV